MVEIVTSGETIIQLGDVFRILKWTKIFYARIYSALNTCTDTTGISMTTIQDPFLSVLCPVKFSTFTMTLKIPLTRKKLIPLKTRKETEKPSRSSLK